VEINTFLRIVPLILFLKKELDWKNLYGLGKGLWEGKDAQDYVSRQREDKV